MFQFTKNGYRKTLSTYVNHLDFDIGYYKLVYVRTYTSPIHNVLNELFSRIKIFDYSNDKHIHTILRIFETSDTVIGKHNAFTDVSYIHYHSIGMNPSATFIISKFARQIRYDSQFTDDNSILYTERCEL
jgi:hypothetical protein